MNCFNSEGIVTFRFSASQLQSIIATAPENVHPPGPRSRRKIELLAHPMEMHSQLKLSRTTSSGDHISASEQAKLRRILSLTYEKIDKELQNSLESLTKDLDGALLVTTSFSLRAHTKTDPNDVRSVVIM